MHACVCMVSCQALHLLNALQLRVMLSNLLHF